MSERGSDEITAHLDRGWELIDQGDTTRAEVAARRVLAMAPESPEGLTLLGAVCAQRGDVDEALDLFDRAIAADPQYVDPLLHAAEVHLYEAGDEDLEAALELCERALEIAEEEDEYLDALLLQAEALFALGDDDAARETLDELPPADVDLPEPTYHLRAGTLLFEADRLEAAEAHLRRALARDPALIDARHALGLVQEARGDAKAMVESFLAVREADRKQPPPAWAVPPERFEEIAEAAFAKLPERMRELLANVPILVEDEPSIELVREGADPRMLGLFAGVPLPEKTSDAVPHLDNIHLYHRNIERFARTPDEMEREIERTLLHETAHFFGLDEEDLEELGLD